MKKGLKRVSALLLAATMAAPVAFAEYSFSDIAEERYSWAADAIEEMSDAWYNIVKYFFCTRCFYEE